jgi:hypothetical protein
VGLREHFKPAVADQAVSVMTRERSFEAGGRRGGVSTVTSITAIVLILGAAAVAWWLVGDLTESGVRDPNYMFTSPELATEYARLIGILGVACVGAGLVAYIWTMVRNVRPAARVRAIVLGLLVLADGLVIGFVLRLLTVGAEGASFTGLTLFLAVPPVIIVSALLIGATRRLARTA